jgi:hypothetical protein
MKKFSPPQMKEVSFPTPYTPHPTPSFKSGDRRLRDRRQEIIWLSWVWWVKCILRYSPPDEGVEQTTKTQRTQRLIDPI